MDYLVEESANVPFEMVHVFAFHLYTACTTGFLTKDMKKRNLIPV